MWLFYEGGILPLVGFFPSHCNISFKCRVIIYIYTFVYSNHDTIIFICKQLLLAHLSRSRALSVVVVVVSIVVVNFSHFHFLPKNHCMGRLQLNLAQSILGWREFKFLQMNGHDLFQWEINSENSLTKFIISKLLLKNLTTGPISTKLGKKHPWVKGNHFLSIEGTRPFPRGDNYDIAKIHWRNSKI